MSSVLYLARTLTGGICPGNPGVVMMLIRCRALMRRFLLRLSYLLELGAATASPYVTWRL